MTVLPAYLNDIERYRSISALNQYLQFEPNIHIISSNIDVASLLCLLAGIDMPDTLRFDLPRHFISRDTYQRALHIVNNKDAMMNKLRVPLLGVVWFVLSQSQKAFKKLTKILIEKYMQMRDGEWPAGVSQQRARRGGPHALAVKQELLDIKNSMYMVIQPADDTKICPCEANHYGLVCSLCKSFAHDGICKHVLAVTHVKMGEEVGAKDPMVNLKLLTMQLSHRKPTGRPAAATPALVPQPRSRPSGGEPDSSDDEQHLLTTAIHNGDYW